MCLDGKEDPRDSSRKRTVRKTKISSFDQDGIRSGRSLISVLEGLDQITGPTRENEEQVLWICRLSFTTTERAEQMVRCIRHAIGGENGQCWKKITFEKTSGRFIGMVIQEAVRRTRVLEIKQHQRYDDIKWNFSIDFFGNHHHGEESSSTERFPLKELHLTGIRFRDGEDMEFLKSLSDGLANGSVDGRIGLEVMELHSCRFLHPDQQYPVLFRGLRTACTTTLQRLWMPKCSGLDDPRMEYFFKDVLATSNGQGNRLRELGFSYNGGGLKASRALISFLESKDCELNVLYVNRQQGELNLEGILRVAAQYAATKDDPERHFQLNLSQNYVSSAEEWNHLQSVANEAPNVNVEMDRMTFEVPEAVLPGNSSNNNNNNKYTKGTSPKNGTDGQKKSYVDHNNLLTQDEIAKLNVACGRVKYVLGRAGRVASATANDTSTSFPALDCILPDLVTILRLQQKQKEKQETILAQEQTDNIPQERRQYQHWLPTFLRKSAKGNIRVLKPLLCAIEDADRATAEAGDTAEPIDRSRRIGMEEREQLQTLWREIEALDSNIARANGRTTGKDTPANQKEGKGKKKYKKNAFVYVPMTAERNPLVRAAYDALPTLVIPASILESDERSPFLSLPMPQSSPPANNTEADGIRLIAPVFIDTTDALSRLRDGLSRRPRPHCVPKMVAIDSEWYFTPETIDTKRTTKFKHRSMSVATLQIAYIDESVEENDNTTIPTLRSFVIDLLSTEDGFRDLAKEFVSWLFGSVSCDVLILGFAFGGDLRQLRKYAGIGNAKDSDNNVSSLAVVESRCLDIQQLLASEDELRNGRVPGLKRCASQFFGKPLKKDDQCSDWTVRPLRSSQLEYAALDAVILLVILSQQKHHERYV